MSDVKVIEVPKWGMSMEEGTVVEWLIGEGETFAVGDDLCELETSKIANVVEAPFSGTLRKILAHPGDTLPVGAPIAISAEADIDEASIAAFLARLHNEAGVEAAAETDKGNGVAAPLSELQAAEASFNGIPDSLRSDTDDSNIKATVHGRKFARLHGVNLTLIEATGRGGRVTRTDVENAILSAGGSLETGAADESGAEASLGDTAQPQHRDSVTSNREVASAGGEVAKADPVAGANGLEVAGAETVPMKLMRRTIARRLQASKREVPHFRLVVDVELDELLALRKKMSDEDSGAKLSINDFIIKACATALIKVPDVNVQLDEAAKSILRFADADIAVAVAMPDGLITPIIKQANKKALREISGEMRELASRAKSKSLTPDEYQGGTFTISNLGMYGARQFDAIINQPQSAILAVGSGEERPIVKDGELTKAMLMTLSLSCDHRLIDGAMAATFMRALKDILEKPETLVAA